MDAVYVLVPVGFTIVLSALPPSIGWWLRTLLMLIGLGLIAWALYQGHLNRNATRLRVHVIARLSMLAEAGLVLYAELEEGRSGGKEAIHALEAKILGAVKEMFGGGEETAIRKGMDLDRSAGQPISTAFTYHQVASWVRRLNDLLRRYNAGEVDALESFNPSLAVGSAVVAPPTL